jgi:hypothetical protein
MDVGLDILLVDDEEADLQFFGGAVDRSGLDIRLHTLFCRLSAPDRSPRAGQVQPCFTSKEFPLKRSSSRIEIKVSLSLAKTPPHSTRNRAPSETV